jgi:hypothetical protein
VIKIIPLLDKALVGCLTAAAVGYGILGFDESAALALIAVSFAAGIIRTVLVYNDFKRRGL